MDTSRVRTLVSERKYRGMAVMFASVLVTLAFLKIGAVQPESNGYVITMGLCVRYLSIVVACACIGFLAGEETVRFSPAEIGLPEKLFARVPYLFHLIAIFYIGTLLVGVIARVGTVIGWRAEYVYSYRQAVMALCNTLSPLILAYFAGMERFWRKIHVS